MPECYKDDVESHWKSLKFDPRHPKTPEPMTTKLTAVTMFRISTFVQNCISIRSWDFVLGICEVAYQMFTWLVLWVVPTRYPWAAAPILSIDTSKDAVCRKDVSFGKRKLTFHCILLQNSNVRSIFDVTEDSAQNGL